MDNNVTLVKCDSLAAVAGATNSVEVDLGLAIDEAARITGISFDVRFTDALIAATYGLAQADYSFDPEDTAPNEVDDEHFAKCNTGSESIAGTTGAYKSSETKFCDFSNMNLITTRNLAFCVAGVGYAMVGTGIVYYEKYKPSQFELVQLIAQRR